MYGFGYTAPSINDLKAAASQAEKLAQQAQQSAEQAERIVSDAQNVVNTVQNPPTARPPAPPVVVKQPSSMEAIFKAYAIPIMAVSVLVVFGTYMLLQRRQR